MCAYYIVEVITYLFNLCVLEGVYPESLKYVKVYKKGNKLELSSYRPISIIPVLRKVLESLVKDQMVSYFEKRLPF
jgi:hypothetical protein